MKYLVDIFKIICVDSVAELERFFLLEVHDLHIIFHLY
jgi:hypothetical protein